MNCKKMMLSILAVVLLAALPVAADPPADPPADKALQKTVGKAVHFDVSPPLRELAKLPPRQRPGDRPIPNKKLPDRLFDRAPVDIVDPVRQTEAGPIGEAGLTPSPINSFEGLSDDDNAAIIGGRVVPPDTEGDVGPNHYVQMINLITGVYDKNGNLVAPAFASNAIWTGSSDICENENHGDPIVMYDHLADRWVFSQFALVIRGFSVRDSYECVAVSTTGDPLGSYFRYTFHVSGGAFDDYPKLGVWPDGYYMTTNRFGGNSFQGAVATAFERDAILAGDAGARFVSFGPLECGTECFFSLQPSHLEGPAPAAGTPNTFVMAFDDETWGSGSNPDGYQLWDFSVDWSVDPPAASFTELSRVSAPEFDANLCGFSECVPQPSPGELLDTLSQFTMFRAQARSFPSYRTMVLNHTVDVGSNRAGIRLTELRNDGTGWSLHQTGTYAPNDGEHRWMGSAAMDQSGNIALGYSVSSGSTFPSVRYNSRTAADALGTLPGGEVELIAGSDVQTDSSNRWGDYSSMSVDPADGCTFWYTQEYQANDDSRTDFDFKTQIGSFVLSECSRECTSSETVCTDGIDDDCDFWVDCDDDDCATDDACQDGCTITEDPEVSCSDGVDNDCDGLVDADDPDCPSCTITEDPEVSCNDGMDNDCDGLVDSDDPDCASCTITEDPEVSCSDGVDNDCDGLIDLDDPDCQTTCELGQIGDPCDSDADCCSNKCRGRPGGMVCR